MTFLLYIVTSTNQDIGLLGGKENLARTCGIANIDSTSNQSSKPLTFDSFITNTWWYVFLQRDWVYQLRTEQWEIKAEECFPWIYQMWKDSTTIRITARVSDRLVATWYFLDKQGSSDFVGMPTCSLENLVAFALTIREWIATKQTVKNSSSHVRDTSIYLCNQVFSFMQTLYVISSFCISLASCRSKATVTWSFT